MPQDHSLWLRRGVVTLLASEADIQAIVGPRVYGERVPALPDWPYIRVGVIIAIPYEAVCLDGMDASFAVNSFSKSEDAVEMYDLRRLVIAALDGASIASAATHTVRLDWTDSNYLESADGWHDITQFQAVTAADF